ncbi:MAG: hypothetical protein ACRC1W_05740 [Shewanella sp.]
MTDTASLTLALSEAQAGDTLVLAAGEYQGAFTVATSIQLQGEFGATLVFVLLGYGVDSVIVRRVCRLC